MGDLIPFTENYKTHERRRKLREREKERLCRKIGVNKLDAPLYDEELRLLAYAESLGRE